MRIAFWLSVLLALGALNDTTREAAAHYVQLGLDPVYAWSTRSQVGQLTSLMEAERDAGRPVPRNPGELRTLLQRNFKSEDLLIDAWGTPYFIEHRTGTVRVVSAGPDRRPGTDDDLKGRPVAARGG